MFIADPFSVMLTAGLFRDYDKKTSLALEKAYTKNEELVKVSSFSVVDLVKMKEVTKFSSAVRKVRRVEMDLPTPVELLAPQPVVIGTQRCIVQTHSAVGNAPLPDSVTVVFDKFNDSPQLADDSEQAVRAILNAHLHTEKVSHLTHPPLSFNLMLVVLLAQAFISCSWHLAHVALDLTREVGVFISSIFP